MSSRNVMFMVALSMMMAMPNFGMADPCGMVPPIYIGEGSPIARTGLQRTYVFFDDGIESFVIRPGFKGKVDNFGMLIPFPTPPAIRKVPDNVFQQIENAVDPPEVVVDLRIRRRFGRGGGGFGGGGMGGGAGGMMANGVIRENQLVVLNEEAVGMYEVAVLAAGSARVLKKWMDENKFVYPEGMDEVTNDYVKAGWCFVAVKTKVGEKSAVDPAPGQRNVKAGMPDGSTFDGAVQGLGFRFETEKLVVPMRLSAFNEGDTRNIVYLLTRGAKKIRFIPEEFVVRQLPGKELVKNMTRPLPLRVIGGHARDISPNQRPNVTKQRDPKPHNGIAKSLFASDLYAAKVFARSESLALKPEKTQKELLAIGEHFGLRGGDYDKMLTTKLNDESEDYFDEVSQELRNFTMTVVDGDFPRDVLANQNLTFENFRMAKSLNSSKHYDLKLHGPAKKQEGRLFSSANPWEQLESPASPRSHAVVYGFAGIGLVLFLLPSIRRRT